MGWTHIADRYGHNDASGTTLDCTATLNVAAGDLIVGFALWYEPGSAPAVTIAQSDAGNAFTMETVTTTGSVLALRIGAKIGAAANASATFRATWASAREYRSILIMQFRPDAGETVSADGGPNAGAGYGASTASGAITTTGSDVVIIGFNGRSEVYTVSSPAIGGTAASIYTPANDYGSIFYRILTGTVSNATATATLSGSSAYWISNIKAFKSVGAAGGVIPVFMSDYRRRRI